MPSRSCLAPLFVGLFAAMPPAQTAIHLPPAPLAWTADDGVAGVRLRCVDASTGSDVADAHFDFAKATELAEDGSLRVPRGVQWFEASAPGYVLRRTKWRFARDARGSLTVPLAPEMTVVRGRIRGVSGIELGPPGAEDHPWWPATVHTDDKGRFAIPLPGKRTEIELAVRCLGRPIGTVEIKPRRAVPNARDATGEHRGIVAINGGDLTVEIPERLLRMVRVLASRRAGVASLGKAGPVLEAALQWLVAHQDADGRWDTDEFMKHDTDGEPCDGVGKPLHDVGVTALASLALLGSGNTPTSGPHHACLARALRWLTGQMRDGGEIFAVHAKGHADPHWIYDHALSTLALIEAYGFTGDDELRATAQKAVDYLLHHRNPYGCWRYQPRDGDNDVSVTCWATRALLAARDHGLEVEHDDTVFKYVLGFLGDLTDPIGRTGYARRGEFSTRWPNKVAQFPPEKQESMTAAALLCRILLGESPDTELAEKQVGLIAKRLPVWRDEDPSNLDFYGWCACADAMRLAGGNRRQAWWKALVASLRSHQRADGNFRGSWDPVDAWGDDGGRVYSTAVLALALETRFRRGPD